MFVVAKKEEPKFQFLGFHLHWTVEAKEAVIFPIYDAAYHFARLNAPGPFIVCQARFEPVPFGKENRDVEENLR